MLKISATIRNNDAQPYSLDRNASPHVTQAPRDTIPQSSSPTLGDVETKTTISRAAIAVRFTKFANIRELDSVDGMTVS